MNLDIFTSTLFSIFCNKLGFDEDEFNKLYDQSFNHFSNEYVEVDLNNDWKSIKLTDDVAIFWDGKKLVDLTKYKGLEFNNYYELNEFFNEELIKVFLKVNQNY